MATEDQDGAAAARLAADLARWPRPVRLEGAIQPYAWGGTRFIPELVGVGPAPGSRAAELWLGAHPVAPAKARLDEHVVALDRLIEASPETLLGPAVSDRFNRRLPYLLKVLDVERMLSIQAHPTRVQAADGFAREEQLGIPLDAPHRNYRDREHKPEMQVALTEFWMLHGFRPLDAVQSALESVPEFGPLAARLRRAAADHVEPLRQLFLHVMTLPQDALDAILAPLAGRLASRGRAGELLRSTPEFWAARAIEQFPLPGGHLDRGIVSIFLMNVVRLEPGQASFIGAGTLHAYLEGAAVEIMASSDNVLRGGLTVKHVDVDELLRVLKVESGGPDRLALNRRSATETAWRVPVEEFELSRVNAAAGQPHVAGPVHGADTLLVMAGTGRVRVAERVETLARGVSVLIPHGAVYAIETADALTCFKAAIPSPRA